MKTLVHHRFSQSLASVFMRRDITCEEMKLPPDTSWQSMLEDLLGVKGYSKTRLAQELGVSRRTITRWATGVTKMPHNRSFTRLFKKYCVECTEPSAH